MLKNAIRQLGTQFQGKKKCPTHDPVPHMRIACWGTHDSARLLQGGSFLRRQFKKLEWIRGSTTIVDPWIHYSD